MSLQGSLSIERMCQMVPVSRRSFYRSLKEQQPAEEEMEWRSAIQQIALEHRRRYGYRRITAELHRRGMQVNHKRVVRIMREDNLLGMQPERFVVTTNSNHKLEIFVRGSPKLEIGKNSADGLGKVLKLHASYRAVFSENILLPAQRVSSRLKYLFAPE